MFLDSKNFVSNAGTSLELTVFFAFFIIFIAVDSLFFRSQSVLEVIFWAELLLVTSIFGISSVCFICNLPLGNVYGIFLLLATAAEAAVGILVVLESSNCGVSQNFFIKKK
jgi:NADH:ubiquinone oxidoreductase subunit K